MKAFIHKAIEHLSFPAPKSAEDAQYEDKKKNYFNKAKSWADECATQKEVTLSWFKLGFGMSMGLNVLLAISVMGLSSIQTLVPLMVHHYDSGVTSVTPINEKDIHNRAQVESDIVRYVQSRESWSPKAFKTQYELTSLLSNEEVGAEYERTQQKSNPDSPINALGIHTLRKVHVYDVHFLDSILKNTKGKPAHHNLAEVSFSISDIDRQSGRETKKPMTALISWGYEGTPEDPGLRWKNWSGFKVTSYESQLRNVEKR